MTQLLFFHGAQVPVVLDPQADGGIRSIWQKVAKDIADTTGAKCEEVPVTDAKCARMSATDAKCAEALATDAQCVEMPATDAKCAEALATDGKCTEVPATDAPRAGRWLPQAIVVSTWGQPLAEALAKREPGLCRLDGRWESYAFFLCERPLPFVGQALVIVGSDKLGTIYGMFHLSEMLGVTAWGFWGDVCPPAWDLARLYGQGGEAQNLASANDRNDDGCSDGQVQDFASAPSKNGDGCDDGKAQNLASVACQNRSRCGAKKTQDLVSVHGQGGAWRTQELASANDQNDSGGCTGEEQPGRSGDDVNKERAVALPCGVYAPHAISKEPSVKYRGFFINDEWPCFGNWATVHYGGFTAELYDHVFEYLLRMKGNYLWPAMWSSSFLLDGPGLRSMELATSYGIYIGMSHHEPCMRSGEEFRKFQGPHSIYGNAWDYRANKAGILRFWEDGLKRVKGQRIFPTVGMRGERDSRLLGEDATVSENVDLLKEVITNQRRLIRECASQENAPVPQLFAIYKEVEDYYFGDAASGGIRGFSELEDVTLLFCEDNHGNMRALPQKGESHPGGYGMYYHLDYHGSPVSYEWVHSTPLSKIWEQMTEAYEYGVRTLWVANAGDVKFQEYPLGYFLELAYDYEAWSAPNQTHAYTKGWVESLFGHAAGSEMTEAIAWVLEESVRLHGMRRAESLSDRTYHPAHYREADRMLARARRMLRENEKIEKALADSPCRDAYFSIVSYPAMGIANLLEMQLCAAKNHLFAAQGRAVANAYGAQLEACIQKDRALQLRLAAFSGGKWKGMELARHIGFVNWNDEDWRYPVRHVVALPDGPRLTVSRADAAQTFTNQYFPIPLVIDDFLWPGSDAVRIQVANGGQGVLAWEIAGACDWLSFSARKGETPLMDEVEIRVLRERLPGTDNAEFRGCVRAGKEAVPLLVLAQNRDFSQVPGDAYLVQDGICAIGAAGFSEAEEGQSDGEMARYVALEDYGKFGQGMKVLPSVAEFAPHDAKCGRAPSLLYRVFCEFGGAYELALHTSPANPLHYGGRLTYLVRVNQGDWQTADITGEAYRGGDGNCKKWADAVLCQEHVATVSVALEKGANTVRIYAQEAGIVLYRLVFSKLGKEKKEAYLGPPAGKKWEDLR